MFYLVHFPIDGTYDVLNSEVICKKNSVHYVRYNRQWYKANVLLIDESETLLTEILAKLLMKPVVSITREVVHINNTRVDNLKTPFLEDVPVVLGQSPSASNFQSQQLDIITEQITPPLLESELISENQSEVRECSIRYKLHSSNYSPTAAEGSLMCVKRNLMPDFDEGSISQCEEFSDDGSEYIPSEGSISDLTDEGSTVSHENISSLADESCDNIFVDSPPNNAINLDVLRSSGIPSTVEINTVPAYTDVNDGGVPTESTVYHENITSLADENCENEVDSPANNTMNIDVASLLSGIPSTTVEINTVQPSHSDVKKFFCIFCNNKYSKLARHLQTVHKDRQEVKAFTALPAGNPERLRIIHLLRSTGNFVYNTNSNCNTGDLMVSRRPQSALNRVPDDYMCCVYCRNFYSKVSLRKHVKVCSANLKGIQSRNYVILGRKVLAKVNAKASEVLKTQIFAHMHEDDVVKCIRYDDLITLFGNELCLRYRDEHFYKMIRSELRLIGRFLLILKKIDTEVTSMADVFNPKRFDCVMDAVTRLGNIEETTNVMKSPVVALHAGTLLRKIAKFYISVSIKGDSEEEVKNTKNFLWLMDTHFNSHVSQTAFESRLQMSRKKKTELPPEEDIRKFMIYLLTNIKRLFCKISVKFDCADWKSLSSFCLLWIIAFNRRRVGEVERLKIEDFNEYQSVDAVTNENVFKSLSSDGQTAAKHFKRVVLRGKLGRTVPILLCNSVFNSIQLILKCRSKAHVPDSNPYVFGLPGAQSNRYLEACKLLRIHSVKCGASRPNLLRGTILRKHIATQCVLLNLTDQEVSDLANYMGHDEKIHKGIYRLPIVAREITQISQILEKAQNIKISEMDPAGEGDISRQVGDQIDAECSEESASSTNDCDTIQVGKRSFHYEDSDDDNNDPVAKKSRTGDFNLTECLPPQRKVPWSSIEKDTVRKTFQEHILLGKIPNMRECCEAIRNNSELSKRSPQAIRTWISTQIKQPSLPNKVSVRKRWTSPEKQILLNEFKESYMNNKLPSLRKCQEVIDKHSRVLKDRTAEIVKAKINNDLKKSQRM